MILRAIGPELRQYGVPNFLADPTLELRNGNGALIASNNKWQDDPSQASQISASGLAPSSNLESAIIASLPPGNYTAIVRGATSTPTPAPTATATPTTTATPVSNTTGVALVEVYDLSPSLQSILGNIGTSPC